MKNSNYRRTKLSYIGLIIGILSITPLVVHAQVSGIEALIKAGTEDATALTKEYFRPLSSGLGAGINSGWQNSARPHARLGFGVQARGAFTLVPSGDKSFDITDLNLERIEAADPDNTVAPTLSGSDQIGPEVIVRDNGEEVASFNLPQGTGINIIPAPELQASIGVFQDTELMVRYVPEVSLGDFGNFNQYGVGAKHRINSTLPGGNTLPVDLALMAGYNRINISGTLNVDPEQDAMPDPNYFGNYDNQEVNVGFDTFTVKALVGKSIPFLTVYGGVGYEFSTMEVDVTGDYPVPVRGPFGTHTETVTDPVSYNQKGDNGMSVMGGLKFRLGLINVFADYTLAKYPVANAGIGFSFR